MPRRNRLSDPIRSFIASYSDRKAAAAQGTGITIRAAADGVAEILIYDEIGFWGVTARDFMQQLAAIDAPTLRVRINSPGGDVFDGLAIYNALENYPGTVECYVDGLAASAASFIALAGDSVTMAPNAFMMIHKAWGFVIGNSDEMMETAGLLAKVDAQLAALYAEETGKPADEIMALMAAETWFTAEEAKAAGFADAIAGEADDTTAENKLAADHFRNTPPTLIADAAEAKVKGVARVAAMRRRLRISDHT